MNETLSAIRDLISIDDVLFSAHALRELDSDRITITSLLVSFRDWTLVEEYPTYFKGPCVLMLGHDEGDLAVHMLWGIAKDRNRPAVLITAYRPDPLKWSDDFLTRRST